MGLTVERELKFSTPDPALCAELATRAELAGYPASAPETAEEQDVYYDTADRRIAQGGYACRLRARGTRRRLMLKGLGAVVGAAHTRIEWETQADTPAVDPRDPRTWPEGALRAQVLALAGADTLMPLFTILQTRTRRMLGAPDVPVAELSLDVVLVVYDGEAQAQYEEIEVERLPGGTAADLTALGAALLALGALPQSESKFARAWALLPAPEAAPAAARAPLGLEASDTLDAAVRKLLASYGRRCHDGLRRLRAVSLADADSAEGVEAVRALRVSTRRLRALLRVFDGQVSIAGRKRFARGLRALARVLGAVRDWDVQGAQLLAYQVDCASAEQAALVPVLAHWRAARAAAWLALMAHCASARQARWEAVLAAVLADPEAVEAQGPRVRDQAGALLWTRYATVRAYEALLPWAPVETLHALRVDGKYLRYTLEFLREILGPEGDVLIAALTALQDHLGALQDTEIAAAQARALLGERTNLAWPAATRAALARYVRDRERVGARLARTAHGRVWRAVVGVGFRRRLARVVAAL